MSKRKQERMKAKAKRHEKSPAELKTDDKSNEMQVDKQDRGGRVGQEAKMGRGGDVLNASTVQRLQRVVEQEHLRTASPAWKSFYQSISSKSENS
ncbi:MAG: hypothetical protein WD424_01560 [Paenibacillaceae bacterium]